MAMRTPVWQVGLDIQPQMVRALAIQLRRSGWQLCHWWQHALPAETLREGSLYQPAGLIEILTHWRKRLPAKISLRIALSPQRVLQVALPAPDTRLREPQRAAYVLASASKQLPLSNQELVLDYRSNNTRSPQVLVTAAQQQEISKWLQMLAQAKLYPDAVDITPCALRTMAQAAGVPDESVLLHRLSTQWLWVAPLQQPFQYGMADITPDDIAAFSATLPTNAPRYYSSVNDEPWPADIPTWSAFAAFQHRQPPLPTWPNAFILAGGLALRADDY